MAESDKKDEARPEEGKSKELVKATPKTVARTKMGSKSVVRRSSDKEKSSAQEEPVGGSSSGLTAGTNTYSSSLTTSGTADTVNFPDRFGYVTVTNLSQAASGGLPLYVRADGQAASAASGETGSYVVPPGESRMIANGAGIWYQSSNVIPHGVMSNRFGPISPTNPSTPSQPGVMAPMEAEEGGPGQNPGTKLSIVAVGTMPTGGVPYVVEAAG